MKQEQLHQIIERKNEESEHFTLNTAARIIEAIVKEQKTMAACSTTIVELRKELAALEVQQLDPKTVLGEV